MKNILPIIKREENIHYPFESLEPFGIKNEHSQAYRKVYFLNKTTRGNKRKTSKKLV